jgi:hypothetical protein
VGARLRGGAEGGLVLAARERRNEGWGGRRGGAAVQGRGRAARGTGVGRRTGARRRGRKQGRGRRCFLKTDGELTARVTRPPGSHGRGWARQLEEARLAVVTDAAGAGDGSGRVPRGAGGDRADWRQQGGGPGVGAGRGEGERRPARGRGSGGRPGVAAAAGLEVEGGSPLIPCRMKP